MNCQQLEKLIHAYQDGELDITSAVNVEEHIGECAKCENRAKNLRTLSRSLRNEGLRFQMCPGFQQRMQSTLAQAQMAEEEAAPAQRGRFSQAAGWMVAAVLAIMGLIAALAPHGGSGSDHQLVADLTANHVRSLMASHLMDVASTDRHTVKPWFDGKVEFAPPVKDLKEAGFPLLGGRLDFVDGHPAAALVYGRQKHIINLFVWPAQAGASGAPQSQEKDGYHLVRWISGGMNLWAVSDLNAQELEEFAQRWSSQ
jgi:anti-sigma factor RsiW